MSRVSRYRTSVPNITSSKLQTKQISFKGGVYNDRDNDDIKITELYEAIDARMVKQGRYKTRKGNDRLSIPAGETINGAITSITGANTTSVSVAVWQAQRLTLTASGYITKATVKVGSTNGIGVLLVDIYSDVSGSPDKLLQRSSFKRSDISVVQTDLPVYFLNPALVANGASVWVVVHSQTASSGTFEVSTTTSATTSKTGDSTGTSWTANSFALNCAVYVTPSSPVLGLIRVNRPNGSNLTIFAAGTSVYSVDEGTGATTVIKSGLNASANKYRFEFVQDKLYWVNGYEKPYVYDFMNVTQILTAPINPDIIIEHVGLLFIARNDDSLMYWSGFGLYDSWTSTDFAYMTAPKTAYTMTAFARLNGVLYTFAEKNKFQLLGEDNNSFSASEAMSQRGTFTQESLTFDDDAIYHADNEGIWAFDGTSQKNLAQPFLQDYRNLSNKRNIVLERWNNRLYAFHCRDSSPTNNACYVINLSYGVYEGLDYNTPIGCTYARKDRDDLFIQGSTLFPAVFYGERDTNDYSSLGEPLTFRLKTAFNDFDTPSQFKRVPKIRPEAASATGNYNMQVGYAFDMDESAITWHDLAIGGSSTRWGSGWKWGDGTRYATNANIMGFGFYVDGRFRRLQRIYQHVAAREPIEFDSETMQIQVERMI